MKDRINIEEWALQIAEITAQRSEDPWTKVGAVALNNENRVIATAYNGLTPHFIISETFWDNRLNRLPFMVHAEQNLCSLFKREDVKLVALTHSPCSTCMTLLLAHGVDQIIFREYYERDQQSKQIAEFYSTNFKHVPKI